MTVYQRLSPRERVLGTSVFILTFVLLFGINVIQIIILPNPASDMGVAAGFPFTCYIKGGYVGVEEFVLSGIILNYLFACIASLLLSYIAIAGHTFLFQGNSPNNGLKN